MEQSDSTNGANRIHVLQHGNILIKMAASEAAPNNCDLALARHDDMGMQGPNNAQQGSIQGPTKGKACNAAVHKQVEGTAIATHLFAAAPAFDFDEMAASLPTASGPIAQIRDPFPTSH